MDFEKIKKLLEPAFTFEGTDAISVYTKKRYPLYSVQGVTNLLRDFINSNEQTEKSKFEVVKQIVDENTAPLYGHTVDAESVAGYLKVWLKYLNDKDAPVVITIIIDREDGLLVSVDPVDGDNTIEWGDGTVTNDTNEHTYEKPGMYVIKVYNPQNIATISNAEADYIFSTLKSIVPINVYCEGDYNWGQFYSTKISKSPEDDGGIANHYEFNLSEKSLNSVIVGDDTLPVITEPNFDDSLIQDCNIIVCKIRGVQSFFIELNFSSLETLSIQSEDLESFKKCVTYFNNGNTAATLTVLKGKHQDEAYQWATENGHFASIVKE